MRNQKFVIGLDSLSNQIFIYWLRLDNTSIYIDYPVETCNIIVFLFGSILPLGGGGGGGGGGTTYI